MVEQGSVQARSILLFFMLYFDSCHWHCSPKAALCAEMLLQLPLVSSTSRLSVHVTPYDTECLLVCTSLVQMPSSQQMYTVCQKWNILVYHTYRTVIVGCTLPRLYGFRDFGLAFCTDPATADQEFNKIIRHKSPESAISGASRPLEDFDLRPRQPQPRKSSLAQPYQISRAYRAVNDGQVFRHSGQT